MGGRTGKVGEKLRCPISQCSEMTPENRWKSSEMSRALHIADKDSVYYLTEQMLTLYSHIILV